MHVNLLMLILRATMPRHFESRNYINSFARNDIKKKRRIIFLCSQINDLHPHPQNSL